jgi:hypothetical protein
MTTNKSFDALPDELQKEIQKNTGEHVLEQLAIFRDALRLANLPKTADILEKARTLIANVGE